MTDIEKQRDRIAGLMKRALRPVLVAAAMFTVIPVCASAQETVQMGGAASAEKPNVILIVSDDQGYGDFGFNANPAVSTPNLDKLSRESVHFTNFHVDPTCSPTRAALLTGLHSMRAGVWHTIMGRSLLPAEHVTLAEHLGENGYATAIFGKWHLGDNYPFRPQDQGFGEVLIHGGGGVGQTPDFWGNTQFDDTYYRNGEPEAFQGYATDIWFDEAAGFIRENRDKPFFAYIALNAPHKPWRAPEAYVKPYEELGLPDQMAKFYAMSTHMDGRIGQLREELKTQGLDRNTILIFMSDNGSALTSLTGGFGLKGFEGFWEAVTQKADLSDWTFNGGLRGFKTEVYEGGHRVPMFINMPEGASVPSRRVDALTAQRVDDDPLAAEQRREETVRAQPQLLTRLVAARGRFRLVGAVVDATFDAVELLMQRPAEGDVDLLDAAAEAEDRHAARDGAPDQRQQRGVAGRIGAVALGLGTTGVVVRLDVRGTAGEQQPVELVEHVVRIDAPAERRDQQGQPARRIGDGGDVLLADAEERKALRHLAAAADADDGRRRGGRGDPVHGAVLSGSVGPVSTRAGTEPHSTSPAAGPSDGEDAPAMDDKGPVREDGPATAERGDAAPQSGVGAAGPFDHRTVAAGVTVALAVAVDDRDAAGLHRLGHVPHQLHDEHAVLEPCALYLDMVGELELVLEGALRDAAMQILHLALVTLGRLAADDQHVLMLGDVDVALGEAGDGDLDAIRVFGGLDDVVGRIRGLRLLAEGGVQHLVEGVEADARAEERAQIQGAHGSVLQSSNQREMDPEGVHPAHMGTGARRSRGRWERRHGASVCSETTTDAEISAMVEHKAGTGTHGPTRDRPGVTGTPRRAVFRTWVVVTLAMMAGALAAGRFIEDDRIGFVFTAVVFPIPTAVLLFIGIAWLVRAVFPRRSNR